MDDERIAGQLSLVRLGVGDVFDVEWRGEKVRCRVTRISPDGHDVWFTREDLPDREGYFRRVQERRERMKRGSGHSRA